VDFGDRIAQIIKENGLSREELGKKVGTSAAIIGRYERTGYIGHEQLRTWKHTDK